MRNDFKFFPKTCTFVFYTLMHNVHPTSIRFQVALGEFAHVHKVAAQGGPRGVSSPHTRTLRNITLLELCSPSVVANHAHRDGRQARLQGRADPPQAIDLEVPLAGRASAHDQLPQLAEEHDLCAGHGGEHGYHWHF